jgi:uncharacterized protein (TIGR02001 family)
MKLNKLASALIASGLALTAVAGHAEEAFKTSGSVAMTTNYFYRGATQSDSAALQGNIMVSHSSGLYFNVWGSSVSAAGTSAIPAAGLELDPSIGYTTTVGDVTYDVGVLHYGYPNSEAIAADAGYEGPDFTEAYASVAYAGAKFGVAYAPDFFAETGNMTYLSLSYGKEVSGVMLSAYVGYSIAEEDKFGIDSYADYKVAAAKSVLGLTAELAVIGNTIKDTDPVVGGYEEPGQAVFTLSKAF